MFCFDRSVVTLHGRVSVAPLSDFLLSVFSLYIPAANIVHVFLVKY